MIDLPGAPGARNVAASFIDAGFTLDGALGGPSTRVDRKGSRFRAEVTFPPMIKSDADLFVSRLIQAKEEGLRMPYPLLGVSQGMPGLPVVDGSSPAGKTLPLRGLTTGYLFREGFWLSIEDAAGQHYLHNVTAPLRVTGTSANVPIIPALRVPFADGATVHLAKPMIEGIIEGETQDWLIRVDHLFEVRFAIKEVA